jgi:hypothetical protein
MNSRVVSTGAATASLTYRCMALLLPKLISTPYRALNASTQSRWLRAGLPVK